MTARLGISVVIPTYNGKHLLERFLPSVVELSAREEELEIMVVDDGSRDGTRYWLRRVFPTLHVFELHANLGFAGACHRGILEARGETIILLNNDVEVSSDLVELLQGHFSDPHLFAVAFDMLSGDTEEPYANRILPIWKQGLLSFDLNGKRHGAGPSFYACGGGMAFSKSKYLSLAGFDPLFHPFYWEDTDLSYRAWKRGWRILFDPRCVVRHHPSSTIAHVAGESQRKTIIERNRLLFLWKSLTDRSLLMEHILWLPRHLLSSVRRKDQVFGKAFLRAVRCVPQVVQARQRERGHLVKKDGEIFELFAE